jgi:hypothetical protein
MQYDRSVPWIAIDLAQNGQPGDIGAGKARIFVTQINT